MSKQRILLVDDETGITTMTKLNLEKTGLYEVLVENRSTHAFGAAKAFDPDLILEKKNVIVAEVVAQAKEDLGGKEEAVENH